jgi:hypothetical protein
MMESRRNLENWKKGDPLAAVRLQAIQDVAESAVLVSSGKNVRLQRGTKGGSVIAVDEEPAGINRAVVVKILAKVAATHGMYDGEISQYISHTPGSPLGISPSTVPGTTAVTPCYVVNYVEAYDIGVTATPIHELELGWHTTGVLFGSIGGSGGYDAKPMVIVNGGRGSTEAGDTTTVGATDEGTEAETGDGWDRGEGPLTLNMVTRVAYYHAGDKKLYGYRRQLIFDAAGCLSAISTETRVEIDVVGACV